MAQQKEIISTINSLIETLKDGQEGFKQAADAVKDPQLRSLFHDYSQQRSRFAGELQSQARSLGESEPEKTSSATGDAKAILAECERGEDSAINEFRKTMEDDLSSPLREVVSRQYREIQGAHDRVKQLRDAAK